MSAHTAFAARSPRRWLALARAITFHQVDGLPAAEGQLTALDGQGEGGAEDRGKDVATAIAFPVLEAALVAEQLLRPAQQVRRHVAVRILVDGQPCRGVRHRHAAQPLLRATASHGIAHRRRDVEQLAMAGASN